MNTQEQIKKYITNQPEPKQSEMLVLHKLTSVLILVEDIQLIIL